jgi:hypothetical protein
MSLICKLKKLRLIRIKFGILAENFVKFQIRHNALGFPLKHKRMKGFNAETSMLMSNVVWCNLFFYCMKLEFLKCKLLIL